METGAYPGQIKSSPWSSLRQRCLLCSHLIPLMFTIIESVIPPGRFCTAGKSYSRTVGHTVMKDSQVLANTPSPLPLSLMGNMICLKVRTLGGNCRRNDLDAHLIHSRDGEVVVFAIDFGMTFSLQNLLNVAEDWASWINWYPEVAGSYLVNPQPYRDTCRVCPALTQGTPTFGWVRKVLIW